MTANDVNIPLVSLASVITPAAVTVQAPAAPVATLTADASDATVGQVVVVTLSITNPTGAASAELTGVTPTVDATHAVALSCPTGPVEALPQALAGGATATFTWSCTELSATGDAATLGATVAATDANSSADVSPAVAGWPVTLQ